MKEKYYAPVGYALVKIPNPELVRGGYICSWECPLIHQNRWNGKMWCSLKYSVNRESHDLAPGKKCPAMIRKRDILNGYKEN